MGVLVGRLLKAALVVVPSMAIGVIIGIAAQAGFLGVDGTPLIGGETMSGRWITPFDSGTSYNRSALFDEEQLRRLYEAVGPAIVSVTGRASRGGREGTSSASGIVIDTDGHLLTNNHVVEGLRGQIDVVLAGGRRMPAEVLGRDPGNDLAVLKVDASGTLPVAPLGDSSLVRPGDLAVAIGNPVGLERAITVGVISGLDRNLGGGERRTLRQLLQTDAAINPGNSGGALLNSRGEVVGINTAIDPSQGRIPSFGGIGYAVPINIALRYLERMKNGEVIAHPFLGLAANPITPARARRDNLPVTQGIQILYVEVGGPVAKAGLCARDIVTRIDGRRLLSMDDLGGYLDAERTVGDIVELTVLRGERELTLQVTLGPWPERFGPRNTEPCS
ncbi:MAG: trypsin-like peptidase domain-containing protein [Chloroflexota bacterium]|nr:trypsin-like peptidase domain-containing protein [Chloroflexota bacterium]